jgi:hypothetical protein
MIAIQGAMRFPVNRRPWLLKPKTRNPQGLALFVQRLLDPKSERLVDRSRKTRVATSRPNPNLPTSSRNASQIVPPG